VETLFDGDVEVAFSQAYVTSDDDWFSDLDDSFVGQTNGLCGAAQPGFLWLTTGTQDGTVRMRAELHDAEPPVDHAWEDIVEVPFTPNSSNVSLTEWAGEGRHRLALPRASYRVRYCCSQRDTGDGSDRYALLFWPSPERPDAVIKSTSESAAYWNTEMPVRARRYRSE
jgi:hypothetical protein